jgi:phenylalanyl-tRNA synthetase beta chain
MKFDSTWLREHLEGSRDANLIADRLTACGCLVELREPGDGAEIWDVEITTNRPDAMNHRGLAREAAVATGTDLCPFEFALEESDEEASSLASVEIAENAACSRYVARVIRSVRVGTSPEWLQRRLLNCGVRPINAVVDATNYVLLELGQPLHAFDLDRLRGRRIIVRPAEDGEVLRTLDGEERRLDQSMLMIADGEGVVALAGIMGGAESEIQEGTTDVLLESAHFDALSVRRTARRLGMHTEASHRFERGCDPEIAATACDRAAALIAELTGGSVCRGRIDVYPRPWQAVHMEFSVAALSAFVDLEIPRDRILEILAGLGFAPQDNGDLVTVTVPSYRVDIERLPDVYEEVIRHVGYAAVPSRLPVLANAPGKRNPNWELVDRARDAAVSAGLAEIMTFSFIDPEIDEQVASQPLCPGEAMPLDNPLARTQGTMRRSLLPGMLAAASTSLNQGEENLALFEQGRVFNRGSEGPQEHERLAVVLTLSGDDLEQAFARLKGVVEHLRTRVGLQDIRWVPGGEPWLAAHSGAVLETADGATVGFAGMLSPNFATTFALRRELAVAELDFERAVEPPLPRFVPLPRYPSVTADMTVEHPTALSYAQLEETVRELTSDEVVSVGMEARYSGPGLPAGSVRTTLRLVYRHPDRSLTQEEVNAAQESLRQGLADRLGVTFA